MRLTFDDADAETKSDDDSDVVEVYIPALDDGRLIVWEVEFVSDDPRFSGTMAMHWYLSRQGGGTLADWIVAVAEANGWHAQSTSVPGVAQRTGA
eukprot:gene14795-18901_t